MEIAVLFFLLCSLYLAFKEPLVEASDRAIEIDEWSIPAELPYDFDASVYEPQPMVEPEYLSKRPAENYPRESLEVLNTDGAYVEKTFIKNTPNLGNSVQ